jgi:GNAT superfamily N-acetyltransferase
MNVIDGAMLAFDPAILHERLTGAGDSVLVAGTDERICGVLVRSGPEIEALAVRRRRRDQGIGTALVERARTDTGTPLIASFDARVRPFYESLGFAIDSIEAGRLRGRDTN